MAADSYSRRNESDPLSEPLPRPRLRNKPTRGLSALSGRANKPTTPSLQSTPEGEFDESNDLDESSELDQHPVVQAFDHYAQARAHLQIVGTLMAGVLAPVQDLITLLDQLLPRQAAAMLSGDALGVPVGAGTPQTTMPGGGPPMMGLGQLSGLGVGAPSGPPQGGMSMMTPPGGMPM